MEETSEYGVLGLHQFCSEERIEVLSNTIERYHSSRKHSQFVVSRKLLRWRLEKSFSKKYTSNTSEDSFETWLDERFEFRSCSTTTRWSWSTIRWRSCSTIQKFPIKPTKFKPWSWQNGETLLLPKHVLLMTSRTSTLKKQIMTERGNFFFAVTQVTSNQCWTRLTSTSEHPDCHILLWNKLRTLINNKT